MPTLLVALPDRDFDPTEVVVPWSVFREAGVDVRFATSDGRIACCDRLVLEGPLFGWLGARPENVARYEALEQDPAFRSPLRYEDLSPESGDALLLPGGHAKGMRAYLESTVLQGAVVAFARAGRPIGAICHGGVALARSVDPRTGRSIVHGRRVTALPWWMEMSAWALSAWKLGDYYRTYPEAVQSEVTRALGPEGSFERGPLHNDYARPFVVEDGQLVTARWPGDAQAFAEALLARVTRGRGALSSVVAEPS